MSGKDKTAGGQQDEKQQDQKSETEVQAKVEAGIAAFIDTHLRNSDFARDTAAWNHFQAGLPVLTGCIVNALEG